MNKEIKDIIGEGTADIQTIEPDANLLDAVGKMSANSIGCLIVKKGDDYVGIITERDVTNCCARCDDVYEAKVHNAMTNKISFIKADDTLEHASQIMRKKGFRHLPVFDDEDKIIYVLSIRDLAFAKMDELQSDMDIIAEHLFTWELNGEKHQFYKDIIGAKSSMDKKEPREK